MIRSSSSVMMSSESTITKLAVEQAHVKRLFIIFAISFIAVHQVVISIIDTESIILVDKINDAKEARKQRKTVQYYLDNFGVKQVQEGNEEENEKMRVVISSMEEYMQNWIDKYDHLEKLKERCINTQDKCVFWASIGECEKNPGFMHTDCMLACQKCDKLLRAPEPVKEGNSQCSTSAGDSAFKKKL